MPQRLHIDGRSLNIEIDIDTCTACQLCYERLPEIFTDRGDGIPLVFIKFFTEKLYEGLLQVAEDCPSGSILLNWTE